MIQYVTGDATAPQGDGTKVIVHCCNNVGAWGAGFVVALSRRWPEPEQQYRQLSTPIPLGFVQTVWVEDDIYVMNLIGQEGTFNTSMSSLPPIRYWAIAQGLRVVRAFAKDHNASVHMPRMGAGLAGGKWEVIEAIIKETLDGCDVTVYDLPVLKTDAPIIPLPGFKP